MLTIRKRGKRFHIRGTVRVGRETRIVKEHSTGADRRDVADAYRSKLEADIRHGPAIILGDGSRLRAKWIAAARVLGDPGAKGARYVDVRVPERAVAGGLTQPQASGASG